MGQQFLDAAGKIGDAVGEQPFGFGLGKGIIQRGKAHLEIPDFFHALLHFGTDEPLEFQARLHRKGFAVLLEIPVYPASQHHYIQLVQITVEGQAGIPQLGDCIVEIFQFFMERNIEVVFVRRLFHKLGVGLEGLLQAFIPFRKFVFLFQAFKVFFQIRFRCPQIPVLRTDAGEAK